MIKYLNDELKKDKELYGVMLENSVIKEILIENIPLLLLGKKDDIRINRLKNIIMSTEEVYLGALHDLSGYVTYYFDSEEFESMKYKINNKEISEEKLITRCQKTDNKKPEWLINLENKCTREPNRLHALVFNGVEQATPTIIKQLSDIIENRMVDGIWNLPDNARIVLVSDSEKKDNIVLDDLSKQVVSVQINTPVEKWLKLRDLEDLSNGLENQESEITFDADLLAFVLCKFWKDKEDVLDISNNVNKLCVISRLIRTFNIEDVLKVFMDEEYIKEFSDFCNNEAMTVDDIISGEFFECNKIRDFSKDILIYFRICAYNDIEKQNIAMKLFEEYDEECGAWLLEIRFWVASSNELKLKLFMELVNHNYASALFKTNNSIRKVRTNKPTTTK